jgi:hypothetical protein
MGNQGVHVFITELFILPGLIPADHFLDAPEVFMGIDAAGF